MRILRAHGHRALPWKNGLGVARIIASQPPEAGYDSLSWQVGTTSIEADCPFSSLPGLDRQFMLLDGKGVELHCRAANGKPDLRQIIDRPLEPFAFSGDWRTECRLLGGPVKVFNVLARREVVSARVATLTIEGATTLETRAGETLLAWVASGAVDVGEKLGPGDAVLVEGGAIGVAGAPGTRLLTVRIVPGGTHAGQ
jgi:environmental stress-induced protein Ves